MNAGQKGSDADNSRFFLKIQKTGAIYGSRFFFPMFSLAIRRIE